MNIQEEKAILRDRVRAKRKTIGQDDRRAYEAALQNRLINLPAFKHARCIAVYNPFGSEAHFVSNMDELFNLDQMPIIAFPIVRSKTAMAFFSFSRDDDRSVLVKPTKLIENMDAARHIEPRAIDLMLVPGIAFDLHGHRLGQGGGYYDRYLPYIREDCITIGIAFDEQIVDKIPCESTDHGVDYIVTPSRIITV